MKKKIKFYLLMASFLALVASIVAIKAILVDKNVTLSRDRLSGKIPAFYSRIEVAYEEKVASSLDTIIVIPRENFNQADLAALFNWYSRNREDASIVRIHLYVNKERASQSFFESPSPRNLCKYDAAYLRHIRTNKSGIRIVSEWFEYRRILELPICSNKVFLD